MIGTEKNERRDWTLLIFIIPIGIILIILVGQLAVRLVPFWRMNTDMTSNLEPDASSARPFALLEPILPQILTPMAWVESYLTPGAEISFPPFLTFEPTFTPSPTSPTPTDLTNTPTTVVTGTPSPTSTAVTGTAVPTDPTNDGGGGGATTCQDSTANNFGDPLPCTYPPTTCQDPSATNFGGPLPCTYPPTTCQDPSATNFGGPLPCTYPPTTCQDPSATNFGGSLPCTYPPTTCQDQTASNYGGVLPCVYGSDMDPGYQITPVPTEIGVGEPPDNTIGIISENFYIVVSLNVTVGTVPDGNYDLVFYEYLNGPNVDLDWMIIGITNDSNGSSYYQVFNWGDGIPDANSNVAGVAGSEADNQEIPNAQDPPPGGNPPDGILYDPDKSSGPPPTNGPLPQTGVLIDVDNAASNPPPGEYNYIVVISPGGGGSMEVDSIDVTEVPIPTPTP